MDCSTDYALKIVDTPALAARAAAMRAAGEKLVFTNGVFDLLHPGHVRYLAEARGLGDALAVGVNADASARGLEKGPGRPFNPAHDRALLLAALGCVDFVVIFDDETPYRIIQAVVPAVLVKGGDWPAEHIVGADIVTSAGGVVRSLPFLKGYSTTALIRRIVAAQTKETR